MCKDLFTLVSKSRLQGRKLEFIRKVDAVFQVFSEDGEAKSQPGEGAEEDFHGVTLSPYAVITSF